MTHRQDYNPIFSTLRSYTRATRSLGTYLSTPDRRLIAYLGWVGRSNLGDEALYNAIRKVFRPNVVRYVRPFSNRLAGSVIGRKKPRAALLGGGTLIGPIQWHDRFDDLSDASRPSVVFGAGVERDPRSHQPLEGLRDWKALLERCSYIGVRGNFSASALSEIGIEAEVLGDPACQFLLESAPPTRADKVLGINFGTTRNQMWGTIEEASNVLEAALRVLKSEAWRFRFVVVWPDDLGPTKNLIAAAGISDVSTVSCIYQSGDEFVEETTGLTVFLGLKLHAVILALCAHTPSVMMSYRPKGMDFMESVGMEEMAIRTDRMTVDWIIDHVEGAQQASLVNAVAKMSVFKTLQQERARLITESLTN